MEILSVLLLKYLLIEHEYDFMITNATNKH